MSTTQIVNNTTFSVPARGDVDWDANLRTYLAGLASLVAGVLQWAVTTFPSAGSFFAMPGLAGASGTEVFLRAPRAGVLRNLYAYCTTAPTVAGCVVTVRVNGVSTTLTCTVAASGQSANDSTHSVAVAAGDRLSVSVNCTGATVTPVNLGITFSLSAI